MLNIHSTSRFLMNRDLFEIAQHCKGLTEFGLIGCGARTEGVIAVVVSNPNITKLTLICLTRATGMCLDAAANCLRRLKYLEVENCLMTSESFKSVALKCKRLKTLKVRRCEFVTVAEMFDLFESRFSEFDMILVDNVLLNGVVDSESGGRTCSIQ
jgi:hypothetical protein